MRATRKKTPRRSTLVASVEALEAGSGSGLCAKVRDEKEPDRNYRDWSKSVSRVESSSEEPAFTPTAVRDRQTVCSFLYHIATYFPPVLGACRTLEGRVGFNGEACASGHVRPNCRT
jgi:hypothetical protein